MLTQKQKRSVVRTLSKAYFKYRSLPFLQVCKKAKVFLSIDPEDPFGGSQEDLREQPLSYTYLERLKSEGKMRQAKDYERQVRRWGNICAKYRYLITLPGKCPPAYKEHVFWHEFCHIFLERLGIYSRYVGHQGYLQQFDQSGGYWVQERLCEAFADAMMLYRHDLVTAPPPNIETFLFADSASIGYAEVARYSLNRIATHCDEAEAAKRNIDLAELRLLAKHQEIYVSHAAHQQMLPTAFYEHHQVPGPRFVDEEKDFEHRYSFSEGKASWEEMPLHERQIVAWIHAMQALEDQMPLLEEQGSFDRAKSDKIRRRVEKMLQKFGYENPA